MTIAKQCPYVSWYKFHKCTVKSCKQYTTETEHCCLAVDRVRPEGTKIISDAEIHFYKYSKDGISTRLVQMKRKSASDRVRNLLILHALIEYIRENKESGGVFTSPSLVKLEKMYPLKIRKLNWQNWMWEYLLDDEVWKNFRLGKNAELAEIGMDLLLDVKLSKFEKLLQEFNSGAANVPSPSKPVQEVYVDRRSRAERFVKRVGTELKRRGVQTKSLGTHKRN